MYLNDISLELALEREQLRLSLRGKRGEEIYTVSEPWSPHTVDGVESYTLLMIWPGIRELFKSLSAACEEEFGGPLEGVAEMKVSGMGRGYMPFDPRLTLLTTYRGAWVGCPAAAAELSAALGAEIAPESALSWLWQAARDGEPYLPYVDYMTTLPGYVHWRLTGERALDAAAAAGIFPLDEQGNYDARLLAKFEDFAAGKLPKPLIELLPRPLAPGAWAGKLQREALRMLDPAGNLRDGIPFSPPEEI